MAKKPPIVKINNPPKSWWAGDPRVEKYMPPVAEAIKRHVKHPSPEFTDIYNRAYEAVYQSIKENRPTTFALDGSVEIKSSLELIERMPKGASIYKSEDHKNNHGWQVVFPYRVPNVSNKWKRFEGENLVETLEQAQLWFEAELHAQGTDPAIRDR